ncbi:hypothetical protein THIOSC13_640003 [uncultured Thiomicrorhabdus sp.]
MVTDSCELVIAEYDNRTRNDRRAPEYAQREENETENFTAFQLRTRRLIS